MDRRRFNPPQGGTTAPVFISKAPLRLASPRSRQPSEIRKIFLQTGIISSASGSAYLEKSPSDKPTPNSYSAVSSTLKLSCAVHGPHPLPRNAPFNTNLVVKCHVRFAPFATRDRRGYARDMVERDLELRLENAVRGMIIANRSAKCMAHVAITVLEAEELELPLDSRDKEAVVPAAMQWNSMSLLAECITVASAALTDAHIECLDLATGGVAARVSTSDLPIIVLDPQVSEYDRITSACVLGYMQSRDEVVELWHATSVRAEDHSGKPDSSPIVLMHEAVKAASLSRLVLADAVKDGQQVIYAPSNKEVESNQMDTR